MSLPIPMTSYATIFSRDVFAPLFETHPFAGLSSPRVGYACLQPDKDDPDSPCLVYSDIRSKDARQLAESAFDLFSEGVDVMFEGESHILALFSACACSDDTLSLSFQLDPFATNEG